LASETAAQWKLIELLDLETASHQKSCVTLETAVQLGYRKDIFFIFISPSTPTKKGYLCLKDNYRVFGLRDGRAAETITVLARVLAAQRKILEVLVSEITASRNVLEFWFFKMAAQRTILEFLVLRMGHSE
jgi:hypothetical protein